MTWRIHEARLMNFIAGLATAMSDNANMKMVQADNARVGAAMHERWILVGTDL